MNDRNNIKKERGPERKAKLTQLISEKERGRSSSVQQQHCAPSEKNKPLSNAEHCLIMSKDGVEFLNSLKECTSADVQGLVTRRLPRGLSITADVTHAAWRCSMGSKYKLSESTKLPAADFFASCESEKRHGS